MVVHLASVVALDEAKVDVTKVAGVTLPGSSLPSTLQLQGVDVVTGGGLAVARPTRIPVTLYGTGSLPNLHFQPIPADIPCCIPVDSTTALPIGVSSTLGGIGTGGAQRTGPDREAAPVQVFTAQVFNNVTTAASSTAIDMSRARWAMVYLDITEAGTPQSILISAEFSRDGGTTWHKWAVDQWVDLRYVAAQMPLLEVVPLNYAGGRDFRITATATGTSAINTFTLSAWVEILT